MSSGKNSVLEVGTYIFQSIAEEYHMSVDPPPPLKKWGEWKVTFI